MVSYAAVTGNASPPPQITLPLAKITNNASVRGTTPQMRPATPAWIPGRKGLDTPISVGQQALDAIKKRKESGKLCNNHYLRGACAKGDSCCFEHHYRPTTEERNAMAFLARMNPCTSGQDCELDDCMYGHHVSFARVVGPFLPVLCPVGDWWRDGTELRVFRPFPERFDD